MHAAPPVRVSLGRSAGWLAFASLIAGMAAAHVCAWALLHLESAWVMPGAMLAAVAAAVAAGAWAWRSQLPGPLSWDGSRWQWAGREGDVQVAVDFDRWMLLRFEPAPQRRHWIALSRATVSGSWPALRAALYSRRPAERADAPPA